MKYEIKYSVSICNIDELRKEHEYIKERMFQLERKMAEMTFNREVGLYAYNLERYNYLLQLLNKLPIEKQYKIKKELLLLENYFIVSRRNYNIIRYKTLRSEYNELKNNLGNYYKAINIDLRNELKDKNLPNIYVYQENNNISLFKHIIIPDKEFESNYIDNVVIYPVYNLDSNREYRHFYNKTSFKYLEELSKDYSYELDNKDLGKVKIKKMY